MGTTVLINAMYDVLPEPDAAPQAPQLRPRLRRAMQATQLRPQHLVTWLESTAAATRVLLRLEGKWQGTWY